MSYVKFEHRHLDDARWMDAAPAAFVVHVWALDWCNEQGTDGRIPMKRAHRLVCPVDPTEIADAFKNLLELDLWRLDDDDYVCDGFLSHGIAAAEQERTRDKWAEDKRRQRLCRVGNHDLCGPRSRCKRGQDSGSSPLVDSTTGQVDDPTRPDPNPKGEGREGGRRAGGSAKAPPPASAISVEHNGEKYVYRPTDLPGGLRIRLAGQTENHVTLALETQSEDGADLAEINRLIKLCRSIRKMMPSSEELQSSHRCKPGDGAGGDDYCTAFDDDYDYGVAYLTLPTEHIGTWWSVLLDNAKAAAS